MLVTYSELMQPPNFPSFYCGLFRTWQGPLGVHMIHVENHWDKRTNAFYCCVSGLDFS